MGVRLSLLLLCFYITCLFIGSYSLFLFLYPSFVTMTFLTRISIHTVRYITFYCLFVCYMWYGYGVGSSFCRGGSALWVPLYAIFYLLCLLCSGLILDVHMLPIVGRLATIKWYSHHIYIFTGDFRFLLQNYFTYFVYLFTASRPAGCLLYIYIYMFYWCDRLGIFFRLT